MKWLALQLLSLAVAASTIACLNLAGRQLTNIESIVDPWSKELVFRFYSADTVVATVSAAALGRETDLYLHNNTLTGVPGSLFRAAHNVVSIDISNNPLAELLPQSFANMPRLQKVTCTNTQITTIPTGFASDCPLLTTVVFDQSAVRVVESRAFVNLPNLESISLRQNNVSAVRGDAFVGLTALHTLDASYNKLTSVPTGLLMASSSWKALDFSHNNILDVPTGIRRAVAKGYISFDYNALIEIDEESMAGASKINELGLASNSIFTIKSRAFAGMSALRTLNLSDNVISVIDEDAFEDVDGLKNLMLDTNNIHRLTLSSFPTNLERLELQNNMMDFMPDFPDNFEASRLIHLNLSRNYLWSISTNDALTPYTGLVTLDLSNNRVVNFSAAVFDPIMESIESMNFDSNLITSIPSTNFIALVKKLRTNVTLSDNPGIGWSSDVQMRADCPNGSVFEELNLLSSSNMESANRANLFGCIQCVAGTFHDNVTGTCMNCGQVSSRAYSDEDGATQCLYCPYSSDLASDRTTCIEFECNISCWLTLSIGIAMPAVIFGSKLLLYLIMRSSKRKRKMNITEQEALNAWRMGLMMYQLADSISPTGSLHDDDVDEEASEHGKSPIRIYDLPDETKDLVLSTLRDYFQIRKEKRWCALSLDKREARSEWNDVEWETFHMHRILSRSYHGEVFLGDYCGTQVVVKRMMTLRFEVKGLADTIKDVELVSSLHHPNIVTCLGTMWSNPEYLCVISEYVKGGDLAAILEVDGLSHLHRYTSSPTRMSASSQLESIWRKNEESALSHGMVIEVSKSLLTVRLQMILDVCKALAYMHSMSISHSDLRSRNIMVTETYRCKIDGTRHHSRDDKHYATRVLLVEGQASQESDSDEKDAEDGVNLEGVCFLRPTKREYLKQVGSSLPLVAPEMQHHHSRHVHVDVYSVGILLLELWFGKYVTFRNVGPNDEREARSRTNKLRLAVDTTSEAGSEIAGEEDLALPGTFGTMQKYEKHHAAVHRFVNKLRVRAKTDSTDAELGNSNCGSTSASAPMYPVDLLTTSLTSSSATTDKVAAAVVDCLQSDPRKRPTANKLVNLFQCLLDEIRAS
ncbi:unnamed protein product [Hyaloperonospora brassicae]|uniref:Protein kinase domain-containing protein n=1 Tax=Hyaloperonospora brassicae TaxID=162125 RepID=A0AAV0T9T6_HYABA|nr:unnamed protein product [Hyaloperonospora brassicae]